MNESLNNAINKMENITDKLSSIILENTDSFISMFAPEDAEYHEVYNIFWHSEVILISYQNNKSKLLDRELLTVQMDDFKNWAEQFYCKAIWEEWGYEI